MKKILSFMKNVEYELSMIRIYAEEIERYTHLLLVNCREESQERSNAHPSHDLKDKEK